MAANTISRPIHPATVDSTAGLEPVQGRGWATGLGNLLGNKLRPWWATRFGLIQAAVWLLIVNGFMALPLWVAPLVEGKGVVVEMGGGPFEMGLMLFFQLAVQIGGIGAAILAMGAIVGEKQSGTAAWVLSKPASRAAFVLAKLIALAAGMAATVVALQAAVAYVQIGVVSATWADPLAYAASTGLVGLYVLFALTLTLMLGAFCKSRGAVVGIAIAVLFGQQLLGNFVGPVAAYFPNGIARLAIAVALGQELSSYGPITTAAVLSVLFVAATIWRFGRDEL